MLHIVRYVAALCGDTRSGMDESFASGSLEFKKKSRQEPSDAVWVQTFNAVPNIRVRITPEYVRT